VRDSWIFDPPREELDIPPSIFSTQSASLIVRCVAASFVFVSGAGGRQRLFTFDWSDFDFQSVANVPVQLLGPMRDQHKTREDAHLTLRVIARLKKRVYKRHTLRLNVQLLIRVKYRKLL